MVDRAEIMIEKNLFLSFGMFWDGGYELVNFFQKMEGYYIHSGPSPITLNIQLTIWMHLTNGTYIGGVFGLFNWSRDVADSEVNFQEP
jgi:hypothetical protein